MPAWGEGQTAAAAAAPADGRGPVHTVDVGAAAASPKAHGPSHAAGREAPALPSDIMRQQVRLRLEQPGCELTRRHSTVSMQVHVRCTVLRYHTSVVSFLGVRTLVGVCTLVQNVKEICRNKKKETGCNDYSALPNLRPLYIERRNMVWYSRCQNRCSGLTCPGILPGDATSSKELPPSHEGPSIASNSALWAVEAASNFTTSCCCCCCARVAADAATSWAHCWKISRTAEESS